jgi:predicted transcriptional regulator
VKLKVEKVKPKVNTLVQGVSLRPEHKVMLDELAAHYGASRSEIVRQCIVQAHGSIAQTKQRAKK